jgi:cell division protein FtsB
MGEQLRKAWDRSVIPALLAVSVVMSAGAGYTVRAQQDLATTVQLVELHSKERASMRRAYTKQLRALTDRNTFLVEQIAVLAKGSNAATKAAIEKVEK